MTSTHRLSQTRFRAAGVGDARTIAELHADSWRRHYRGAYSDAFLDGDVVEDRCSVWSERLRSPGADRCTIVAERADQLVGFAHSVFDKDVVWGALLDNLHVTNALKRSGLGTRLLTIVAQAVLDRSSSSGMYLWVLEQNSDAQAFYARLGGTCVGREYVPPPGGDPSRLVGRPICLRYAWRDPSKLLADSSARD
jgi:GNAT superfamily N-acetyltransferase